MTGLGRVNLLVGSNNSGKTSILEAIYLLDAMGDPSAIWKLLSRRGEWLAPDMGTAGEHDWVFSEKIGDLPVSIILIGAADH